MHKIDDPTLPPPHLLEAVRRSVRTRLVPYVPRKLPGYVIDEIRHQIALDQRAAMVKTEDPNLPPRRLLLTLRRHGRNRSYVYRRLSRSQLSCLPLSRIVEIGSADDIAEEFSDDAIAEIAEEHGVTPEEIRANPRAYIWDMSPDDAVAEPTPVPASYLAIARLLGATEEEARDSLRHPRISFELPRARTPKERRLAPRPRQP